MGDNNHEEWLKENGVRANYSYDKTSKGFQVVASYYRANPTSIKLCIFTVEDSAKYYIKLLQQRYQQRAVATKKQPARSGK